MKTRQYARGFVGALSLLGVIGAIGCSAEPLSPEEAAEIGSTSQALTNSEISSAGPSFTSKTPSSFASSALVRVAPSGGTFEDYILVAGGQTAVNGTGLIDNVKVIRVSNGSVTDSSGKLPAAATRTRMIQKPGDSSKALVFGGRTGANTYSSAVTELTLVVDASHVPTNITTAASGTMNAARSNFEIAACGSASVIIVGGRNAATGLASVDVWTNGSISPLQETAANGGQTVSLAVAVSDFGLAYKDSTHFAVFGGTDATPARTDAIQKIVVDSNCKLVDDYSSPFQLPVATVALANPRQRLGAFYKSESSGKSVFAAVGGNLSGGATNKEEVVTIDWTFASPSDSIAAATTIGATADAPTLFFHSADRAYLMGGDGVNAMQEYNAGWTSVTTNSVPATLDVRFGSTVTLANSLLYVIGGQDASNVLASTLLITP